MRTCKSLGCKVLLLTSLDLKEEPWPRESLDDIFYIPEAGDKWSRSDLIKGVSYMARTVKFDKIVALDDFDLERAALLREHIRIPGMGDTRTRYFRDKLAMRTQALEAGIPVPPFVHVLNHARIHAFVQQTPAPWVLKPRSQASATGIKKVRSASELWHLVEALGDQQSFYLLEQFIPGNIYHVDSVVFDEAVVFERAHQYTAPPLEVAHEGGIFATMTVDYGSEDEQALLEMNKRVIKAMGLKAGVSHTEFIRDENEAFYFLETSARVGGAHIAEMLEASSGINLWAEWAKIETLPAGAPYHVPVARQDHAGVIISLARQEKPDTSSFNDPEIVWRMSKKHHIGLIVQSAERARVKELLDDYALRIHQDHHASHPPADNPTY